MESGGGVGGGGEEGRGSEGACTCTRHVYLHCNQLILQNNARQLKSDTGMMTT